MKKVFSWPCSARWSHAGHVPGRPECNTFAHSAHSAHARAWLPHGACKFYRCERSYSIYLRQLPPRLVRVLLVQLVQIYALEQWTKRQMMFGTLLRTETLNKCQTLNLWFLEPTTFIGFSKWVRCLMMFGIRKKMPNPHNSC